MQPTSATLLERLYDRGDDGAWRRFVDLYGPLVRAWLRRHLPQDADVDDLAQQVFTVVVEKFPAFKHVGRAGAFRAWLRGICANRLRMFWRSGATPSPFDPEPVLQQLEDPHSELSRLWDQEHDAYLMQRVLELLAPEFKPATWRAFQRVVVDGANPVAVAGELGLSINAVCIAKSRVLRRLREELQGLVS